mgnify:FL=1
MPLKEEKGESQREADTKLLSEEGIGIVKTRKRKNLKEFMDSIKGGLIELFKEEGDEKLN